MNTKTIDLILMLFNDSYSTALFISLLIGRITFSEELERIWKEEVMAKFKPALQLLLEKPQNT
jgi:hypothetical protein